MIALLRMTYCVFLDVFATPMFPRQLLTSYALVPCLVFSSVILLNTVATAVLIHPPAKSLFRDMLFSMRVFFRFRLQPQHGPRPRQHRIGAWTSSSTPLLRQETRLSRCLGRLPRSETLPRHRLRQPLGRLLCAHALPRQAPPPCRALPLHRPTRLLQLLQPQRQRAPAACLIRLSG